jgi:transposase
VLKEQVVEEIVARLRQGAKVSTLAAEYGIDRKTIRAWRAKGSYQPRAPRRRVTLLEPHAEWLRARAPEVEFNTAVLYRELVTHRGYSGSAQQVLRFVRPLRVAARQREATVRYETAPGQQAQVDFGQRRVWLGGQWVGAHVFVFTLGFSRRLFPQAYPHERLAAVLDGHERAFHHFGGVPAAIVVDNAKPVVLEHTCDRETRRHSVVWHPTYADFASYYGFRPWAHWPYRPQTKGKTESGVKYVQRNALVGKQFRSWDHLNDWLLEWALTVADTRVHGTTHELPRDRFAREHLAPLGGRLLYQRERIRHRVVATDALVAIDGSRYSVPVQYVGATVVIRELMGAYEILAQGQVIARHRRLGRHQVVMEPQHYAGLLRPRSGSPSPLPPRHDPGYPASADVAVRDLAVYAALVDVPTDARTEEVLS